MRALATLVWAGWAWCAGIPCALAHPLVDEGVRQFDAADFPAAIDAFGRAEASRDLTLDDLRRLLRYRALAYFAEADEAGVERDLTALAQLEPDARLGPDVPPQVREAFARARERIRGPLALVIDVTEAAGGAQVRVAPRTDPAALVREVHVAARAAGTDWIRSTDGRVLVPAAARARLEIYAVAIGPGGAALARLGDEADPEVRGAGSPGATAAAGSDDGALLIGLGVGGAVAAVAVVVAVVAVVASGGGSDGTVVGAPRVMR